MKTTRVAIAALLVLAALSPLPAQSAPDGCVAVGTGVFGPMNTNPWDCFFTASGPSVYTANTTNPFVIAVHRGGSWVDLVRRPTPGAPRFGILATGPGERVAVSISCWNYTESSGCGPNVGGTRLGVIWAQSEI